MNTRDIPIVILGSGLLYVAYLLQNNRLHMGFEGFQVAPTMAPEAPPMAPQAPPMAAPMAPEAPPMAPEVGAVPAPVTPPPVPTPTVTRAPAKISQENAAQILEAVNTLQNSVKSVNDANAVINKIQQISQMAAGEGFQSYQNPYNTPSPNIQQAYEFRLGKRSLVDEVVGVMNT